MYLSKLELHGFKSFALPTTLQFDPGITAIVGPNGCGKSNVVDAIRWVIGEQRARVLRSEKMENVIFNGTARRRPLGMSEVLLTIENTRGVLPTEYSEVTIGRRLFRSGESDYLLNGTSCRLKDILDLFMDTGMGAGAYSIIELKMIEEILSENTQDRRHLFEEAAGITKYKQRRTQTLRRLDSTQADLTRLRDLTEEIEKRVRSLKRQAAKAQQYHDLEGQRRHLELTLASLEYDRLVEEEAALQQTGSRLEDLLEHHVAALATQEATLAALRKTQIDQEQALSERQQDLNNHLASVKEREAALRLDQERLDHAQKDRLRTQQEHRDAATRQGILERRLQTLEADLTDVAPQLEAADQAVQRATMIRQETQAAAEAQRAMFQTCQRQEQQLGNEHADHLRRLDRLSNRLELAEQERLRIDQQAETLARQAQEQEAALQAGKELLVTREAAVEAARTALEAASQQTETLRQQLQAEQQALHQVERALAACEAEKQVRESLISSFEDFSHSIRFLASTPSSWTSTPLRTVAELLTCDPAHQATLDAALGDLASCLAVQTLEEALRAMALLTENEQGRTTFLVLERLAAAPALPVETHAQATPLRTLVQGTEAAGDRLMDYLLKGCYLVKSLEEGLSLTAQLPGRYFTPTGEWVDGNGLIHGGSATETVSVASERRRHREQWEALVQQSETLGKERATHQVRIQALQQELGGLLLADLRNALSAAQKAFSEEERTYTRASVGQEILLRQQENLKQQLINLETNTTSQQAELPPLQEAVNRLAAARQEAAARREEAEKTFQEAEMGRRKAEEQYGEAKVAALQVRNRHDNLKQDLDRTRQEAQALQRRQDERLRALAALEHTIEAAQQACHQHAETLETIRAEYGTLDVAVAEAREDLLQTRVAIDQAEAQLRTLRQAREDTMRQEHSREVRQVEIHTRKEDLIARTREDFDVVLGIDDFEIDETLDEHTAPQRVQELKQKIKALGQVNALALEEYEEEKTRFEFMTAQKADLEQAEATLLQTIDEINTTASERFRATYDAIRESFRTLFSELFGQDASADLNLTHPSDLLESPIEIVAKPRGKRPISISQLSSGEKTLTAIALLFAIYLVKPSPFCFLDEVDAPLDDANIDRFMRLIRRFADQTQFILVTHNKRTMELADRLYGITMQEQGVSRLVEVRFEEALEMVEAEETTAPATDTA